MESHKRWDTWIEKVLGNVESFVALLQSISDKRLTTLNSTTLAVYSFRAVLFLYRLKEAYGRYIADVCNLDLFQCIALASS